MMAAKKKKSRAAPRQKRVAKKSAAKKRRAPVAPRTSAKKRKPVRRRGAPSKAELARGDFVKARFKQGRNLEKMWVRLTFVSSERLVGRLDSKPVVIDGIRRGDEVVMRRADVIETARR